MAVYNPKASELSDKQVVAWRAVRAAEQALTEAGPATPTDAQTHQQHLDTLRTIRDHIQNRIQVIQAHT